MFDEKYIPENLNDQYAPDDLLLDTWQAANMTGLSTAWYAQKRRAGDGPAFIYLSPTCVRYRLGELRRWFAGRSFLSVREAEAAGMKICGGPGRGRRNTPQRVLDQWAAAEKAEAAASAAES